MKTRVSEFSRATSPIRRITEPMQGTTPIATSIHPYIDFQIERHIADHGDDATHLFSVVRSKNYNTILFDYRKSWDEQNSRPSPMDSYFLVLDPSFLKQKYQKSNGMHPTFHREEMSFHEKRVYGILGKTENNLTINADAMTKSSETEFKLAFLPDRVFHLRWDAQKAVPYVEGIIDGKKSKVQKIFLETKDRFMGAPIIQLVYVFGMTVEGEDEVQECIA
eukprot:g13147.t1